MSETIVPITSTTCVLLAVPLGRNDWVTRQTTLHYEAGRLIQADGIDLMKRGPKGLTGTMYVVKASLCRDTRPIIRIEGQKIVNGLVVDVQNWGEIEIPVP